MITHHPFEFKIGPLPLTGFGIAMVMAFVIAQRASETEMARRGYDPKPFADVTLGAVIGGLLGAKIYYAILHGASILSRDGFVFWGGLIGGIIGTWVVINHHKLGFIRISDLTAPGLAAAYSVGRSGCWAVGDDYGKPWNGPLAVAFPEGQPRSTAGTLRAWGADVPAGAADTDVLAVHPTQIYEVILGFIMFALLWRMRDHKHAEGWLFGAYCVMAGVERLIIEFFRAKDDRFFGPMTLAQLIAIGFIVFGVVWMQLRKTPGPGKPGIYATDAAAA